MKKILVLGAGRSSHTLIKYLLNAAKEHQWQITVADRSLELAKEKVDGHSNGEAITLDIFNDSDRINAVRKADLVISLLPASLHIKVAHTCLAESKSLMTASYVSEDIQKLHEAAKDKGLLFLNEIGLDPGIDHMSAMQIINHLQDKGASINLFKSFTGGLVAPEYDTNPWNYKFTWNPRNVVLAGQGTAKYLRNGQYKYIPYHKLFNSTEKVHIDGYGVFEGYPNRDSLSYIPVYGLENIPTMVRGTLRREGFSRAWNAFVQLGMTDDTYRLENSDQLTNRDFINTFLPYDKVKTVEEKVASYLGMDVTDEVIFKLRWLGMFENKRITLANATPAQILQNLLEKKWELLEEDKDMIVMQHKFGYTLDDKEYMLNSSMVVIGDDKDDTAMAKTVGLPLAIAAKLFLLGKIKATGVQIPVEKVIYEPVLEELATAGIIFTEEEKLVAEYA